MDFIILDGADIKVYVVYGFHLLDDADIKVYVVYGFYYFRLGGYNNLKSKYTWILNFISKNFDMKIKGNSIVYRNHRIYGGSPPSLCWLWWQSTI